jgi:Resolvase, N terminal domain
MASKGQRCCGSTLRCHALRHRHLLASLDFTTQLHSRPPAANFATKPQQLLRDIQARKIDCVVVYKVDRLSRSLLDFARLLSLFASPQKPLPISSFRERHVFYFTLPAA